MESIRLLAPGIKTVAPHVIEMIMTQIFDTMVYREESFELADYLAQFYDELGSSLYSTLTESELKRKLRSSSSHHPSLLPASNAQYHVILHHDDNHTSSQTSHVIRASTPDISDTDVLDRMRTFVNCGECVIKTDTLLRVARMTSDLITDGYRVSVAPTWQQENECISEILLVWLKSIASRSDGLSAMIADASNAFRTVSRVPHLNIGRPKKIKKEEMNKLKRTLRADFVRSVETEAEDKTLDWTSLSNQLDSQMKTRLSGCLLKTESPGTSTNVSNNNTIRVVPMAKRGRTSKRAASKTEVRLPTVQNRLIEDFLCSIKDNHVAFAVKEVRTCYEKLLKLASGVESRNANVLMLLVRNCSMLPKRMLSPTSTLFHELILDTEFKSNLMGVFLSSYKNNSMALARGHAVLEESIFDFSIQLFSVASLVKRYVLSSDPQRFSVLGIVLESLHDVLQIGTTSIGGQSQRIIRPDHIVIQAQGRYRHCIDNLENVLNVENIPRQIMSTKLYLAIWLEVLSMMQCGDKQSRRGVSQNHVEYESDSWVAMFNLCIRMHSIFPLFSKGISNGVMPGPVLESTMATVIEAIVTRHAIDSIKTEGNSDDDKVEMKQLMTLDAMLHDSPFVQKYLHCPSFSVSRNPASFHIPLHRFFIAMMSRVLFLDTVDPVQDVRELGFNKYVEEGAFPLCLVDMPLRCLVLSSQIQSNLWRRNGEENMLAQIFNYTSLPFCSQFQDADVLMLQIGGLMMGPEKLLSLIVNRFELASFFIHSPAEKGDGMDGLITGQHLASQYGYEQLVPGMDAAQMMQMIEELMRLILILGLDLPSSTGNNRRRDAMKLEVLHQLCSKVQTFSELSELAILPGGNEDAPFTVPFKHLESALEQVARYHEPHGLEPGRYELKEECINEYNPYFLHLSREAHQSAREKWARYRKKQHDAISASLPMAPVLEPSLPIPPLRKARQIFISSIVIGMARNVLTRLLDNSLQLSDKTESVVTVTLHVIVYGIYTALEREIVSEDEAEKFFTCIAHDIPRHAEKTKESLLVVLVYLLENESLIAEHRNAIKWILLQLETVSAPCRSRLQEIKAKKEQDVQQSEPASRILDADAEKLKKRKEARARAIAAMAKQRASFQTLMDTEEKEDDEEALEEEVISDTPAIACILCHETTDAHELGYVAFVQHSAVLSNEFRPSPSEALHPTKGKEKREDAKAKLKKLEFFLPVPDDDHSCLHPPGNFLDWAHAEYLPTSQDDSETSMMSRRESFANAMVANGFQVQWDGDSTNGSFVNLPTGPSHNHATQHNHHEGHNHCTDRPPMDNPEEPVPILPVGVHLHTCHHAVHINCLERYTSSLYQKSERGEDFDGCQAM